MPFLDSLDVANRALQHCGAGMITSVTEDSKRNRQVAFAYDKVRRAELQRNTWRFAIKKTVLRAIDTTTMRLVPSLYDATKTYLPGAVVKDINGQYWVSNTPENINNTPGDTAVWDMYFGPLAVSLYSSTQAYFSGELVYKLSATAGAYQVYMSLQNANSDDPGTATAWDATVTYKQDDVVSQSGSQWRSLLPVNLNITPADGPAAFDAGATYSTAQTVTASDNFIYSSVGSGNVGHDPTTDGGVHWTNTNVANGWSRSPTLTPSSIKWLPLVATLANLTFIYPIASGPSSQTTTRNVYRLPAGYLSTAPQFAKAGAVSYLGAPSGLAYTDWEYDGDYIVSADVGPIVLRFVADIVKVTAMDDMFCEGLACRVAEAVCEPLTQSSAKLASIASEYTKFMGEARTKNAIEEGWEDPPVDDYIACRA